MGKRKEQRQRGGGRGGIFHTVALESFSAAAAGALENGRKIYVNLGPVADIQ